MKTLRKLTAALLFSFAGLGVSAASTSPSGNPVIEAPDSPGNINGMMTKTLVQDQINEHIGYPKTANKQQTKGTVNFIFRINQFNKVELLDIYGDNPFLVDYVENSVDGFKIHLPNNLQGKAYRMIIDFKPAI